MDRLTLVEGNQNSAVAAAHEQAGEKVCAAGNEARIAGAKGETVEGALFH